MFSIERQRSLFDHTRALLTDIGYGQIKTMYGDGYAGLPAFAPFDRIIVTAAAPQLPKILLKQLKIGGHMIIPIGSDHVQVMHLYTRLSESRIQGKTLGKFNFVPMLQHKATD